MRNDTKTDLAVVAVAAVTYGVVGFLFWFVHGILDDRSQSIESRAWPSTTAMILDSNVDSHSMGRYGGRDYFPVVHYRFSVDRDVFVSDRVSFGGYGSEESAKQAVAKYPAGSTVTVWFRPSDPRDCVLEPDSWDGEILVVLGLAMMLVLGLFALLLTAVLSILWFVPLWVRYARRHRSA